MSYDVVVFAGDAAPKDRDAFIAWYMDQTEWDDDRPYDDPAVASPRLQAWFDEMIAAFPPMNGPLASDDLDDPRLTDYSIGSSLIYAAFAWSQSETAHDAALRLAQKHGVGFFDVSGDAAAVVYPDGTTTVELGSASPAAEVGPIPLSEAAGVAPARRRAPNWAIWCAFLVPATAAAGFRLYSYMQSVGSADLDFNAIIQPLWLVAFGAIAAWFWINRK